MGSRIKSSQDVQRTVNTLEWSGFPKCQANTRHNIRRTLGIYRHRDTRRSSDGRDTEPRETLANLTSRSQDDNHKGRLIGEAKKLKITL